MTQSRWQDEVSEEQWDTWLKFARSLSKAKKVNTSLGPEDYAAQAIEILLEQEKKPANGGAGGYLPDGRTPAVWANFALEVAK